MLRDFVDALKLLVQTLASSSSQVKGAALNAVFTIILVTIIYVGAFVIREGSLFNGVQQAYMNSWLNPTSAAMSQTHSQDSLRHSLNSNKTIQAILNDVLRKSKTAARVRLDIIHNGVYTITGIDLLKFDITNSVAAPGRESGEMLTNMPLSEWTPDFTPSLLKYDCVTIKVSDLQNIFARTRYEKLNADTVMQCPVIDVNNQIFGAIRVIWDKGDTLVTGQDMKDFTDTVRQAGRQIGIALDINHNSD